MECNKEEAVRAKVAAEKRMESKDFVAARKMALKAQQLYPDLENISQMITVCDVHCSAENKLYGNEKDWYGILKIEPLADDVSIKKQYRKFALVLHPDKNKFAGATDAFKLIGEAQRVLLDREKRMLHDSKCKAAGRYTASNWASQQASGHSNVGNPPWVQNNFMSHVTSPLVNQQRQQPHQRAQPGFYGNRPTFWTVCPFCSVRYQFYKDVLNKNLWCQSCKKSFPGYETNAQGVTQGTNWSRPAFPQQKEVQNQGPFKAGPKSENTTYSFPKKGSTSEVGEGSKPNEKYTKVDLKINKGKSEEPKSKRRKQVSESSESCSSESSTDSEEDIVIEDDRDNPAGQNFGSHGEQYLRRSNRSKRHVSYSENLSDDDDVVNPSKRAKGSESFHGTEQDAGDPALNEEPLNVNKPAGLADDTEEDEEANQKRSSYVESLQNGLKETEKANEKGRATEDDKKNSEDTLVSSPKSSPDAAAEPETYEYPDPDFSDFDKDRKEECFEVGQIWAVYDTRDAMPRFHVRIRKLLSPGFKLRITWLESDPDHEDEIKWVEEDLPISCGEFRYGNSEYTEDHPMFSHLVYWEKGSRRDTFKIYPREGETWALFKNWDIKWNSDANSQRKYEYEFVEVLSDYADDVGVWVAYLSKVKGFSCLFWRKMEEGLAAFKIPPKEILRFSHRVPSFQMTGEEREGVPVGSFELDPASLPTNLEGMHPNGSCSRSQEDSVEPKGKDNQP